MNKKGTRFALCALLVATLSPVASACMLKITCGQDTPVVGTADTITLQFIQSHRNCTITPESTVIETDGLKILSSSGWAPVRNGVYERTFKVEYTQPGDSLFRAVRTCPKGGMTRQLTITVQ